MFVLGEFTVASDGQHPIHFANGAHTNLNTGDAPTTVTATDENGNVHTDRVLLNMWYTTGNGNVIEYTASAGTAEEFVKAASSTIHFVTQC